jgi:hypothetical protein
VRPRLSGQVETVLLGANGGGAFNAFVDTLDASTDGLALVYQLLRCASTG